MQHSGLLIEQSPSRVVAPIVVVALRNILGKLGLDEAFDSVLGDHFVILVVDHWREEQDSPIGGAASRSTGCFEPGSVERQEAVGEVEEERGGSSMWQE